MARQRRFEHVISAFITLAAAALCAQAQSAPSQPTTKAVPAGTTELTVTIQQGVDGYDGCVSIDAYKTVVKPVTVSLGDITLKFTKLNLPGNNPKIIQARLLTNFKEEGYSKIKSATIEMSNPADGKVLDSVAYKAPQQLERVTKENRWLAWNLPTQLVQQWVDNDSANAGVRFIAKTADEGNYQFLFNWAGAADAAKRPKLEITYQFEGNAAPFQPQLTTNIDGKTFGPNFTVAWKQIRFDPNNDPCTYEVEIAPAGSSDWTKVASADANKLSVVIDSSALATDKKYLLRVSGVDASSARSAYAQPAGAFQASRDLAVVWPADSVTKVQQEQLPTPASSPAPVALESARNEVQSFQVVVTAQANLQAVDASVDDFIADGGAKIPAGDVCLYRVNYVDCKGQGLLPDSMVPFIDPASQKRIGGKFGAPFDVTSGQNVSIWVELSVPADAKEGLYKSQVKLTIGGKALAAVPVSLKVYNVTMPKETTLLTYINLSSALVENNAYMQSLHKHRMDIWNFGDKDIDHECTITDGKVQMKWNPQQDKLLDSYFDGSMFPDGVPGKCYLLMRAGAWKQSEPLAGDDDNVRIQILQAYQEHYKDKPYCSKLAWFFIDEPKPSTLKKCQKIGEQIAQYTPSIRFLLTTRFNPDLEAAVGIWDAIVNYEIIAWNTPGPDAYRAEKAKGKIVLSCVTVNCNEPASPNVFIHYPGMNTRIWPWMSFALDQDGIEYWNSKPAPSVTVPKLFGDSAWGDGSLFYKGLPAELGTAAEVALPSIRLKMLRDGIQDHELLSMLNKKDPALAKTLCHKMVQETKDYDKSFLQPVPYESWNWNTDKKGDRKVPGFIVWEASPKALAQARSQILQALSK